jgi:glycosyltransferase involved in cell wall biosynthesis
MTDRRVDILMITYRTAEYVRRSLPPLLDSCGENDRVWLWHNGDDEETLEVTRSFASDPRVARFHHSRENVRVRPPTNWMWSESSADFVSKVDDDCIVSDGWLDTFEEALRANPEFGVVGSWRFYPGDGDMGLARKKIACFAGGHQLMRNLWVQGSGYLLARRWIQQVGLLRDDDSFPKYCIRLARSGSINGWYYPFVFEDHMDDPRSPNTLLHSDADLLERLPLSAQFNGIRTLADWQDQIQRSVLVVQSASLDPRNYSGWRSKVRSGRRRILRAAGRRVKW